MLLPLHLNNLVAPVKTPALSRRARGGGAAERHISPHLYDLDLPMGMDTTIHRWMSRVRDVVRGAQSLPRTRVYVSNYASRTSFLPIGDVIPYVDRDIELTAAYWSQSGALSKSSTAFWTFYLDQGPTGVQQSNFPLGKADSTGGLSANEPLDIELRGAIVRAGNRVTFWVGKTGVADTLGPGVLFLYAREVW